MDNITLKEVNQKLEEFSGQSYYSNVKKIIDLLVDSQKYKLAEELIAQELKVPYIEADFQQYLINKYDEVTSLEEKDILIVPMKEIHDLLRSRIKENRAIAIDSMRKHNLRNHLKEIEDFLIHEKDLLLRNLMYEVLFEQNIKLKKLSLEIPDIDNLKRDLTFSKIESEIDKMQLDETQSQFMKENAVIMVLNNFHVDLKLESIIKILESTNLHLLEIENDSVKLDSNEKKILINLINQL